MKNRAFRQLAATAAIVTMASLFTATGATALTASATQDVEVVASTEAEEVAASRAFLTQYGVKTKDQDRLIEAALRGELSLADTPGAAPVKVKSLKEAGAVSEVSTFADGSISVVTRETPAVLAEDAITPMAVTGCTVRTGSGYNAYTGCKVHYRTHVFSYGMYANFTITPYWDQIDSLYSFFQEYAVGHSLASYSMTRVNIVEDPGVPAHGQLSIRYNVLPSGGQINKGLRLKVANNTYWQENS